MAAPHSELKFVAVVPPSWASNHTADRIKKHSYSPVIHIARVGHLLEINTERLAVV